VLLFLKNTDFCSDVFPLQGFVSIEIFPSSSGECVEKSIIFFAIMEPELRENAKKDADEFENVKNVVKISTLLIKRV
jgi:hypothetical protein